MSANNFINQITSLIDMITEILDELGRDDLGMQSTILSGQIKSRNPDDMINAFIDNRKYWMNIKQRNNKFILEELPQLLATIQPDTDFSYLALPLRTYIGGSKLVQKDDIDSFWKYLNNMVKLACKYVHERNINIDVSDYE